MLPTGDRTPSGYNAPLADWREQIKRPLRRYLYPPLNAWCHRELARRYDRPDFSPDLWLLGQRGNDYERHRRRVNEYLPLSGKTVLVAGCGTGRDIESWLSFQPTHVLGIDWFAYDRAWAIWRNRFHAMASQVTVAFQQGDLAALSGIADCSVDVVGSDAVFEHLRNLPAVLQEFRRVLRPGGVLYATFGPLWHAWGGDHVSGYDGIDGGFNHLLLGETEWKAYLARLGSTAHSEHDGRTWVDHGLFSYLKPREYLRLLYAENLQRLFVGATIDSRAIQYLRRNGRKAECLLADHDLLDLLVTGMTVVYRKA